MARTSCSNSLSAIHRGNEMESKRRANCLHVTIDRLARFHDPEANQRQLQFVAQIAQRVQDDALFAPGCSKNIMDLVQDQHLDAEVIQQAHSRPFEFDDCGARVLRRTQHREDLREKPALVRPSRQFDNQQLCLGPVRLFPVLSA